MKHILTLLMMAVLLAACGRAPSAPAGRRVVLAPGPTTQRPAANASLEPTPTNTLVLPEPWTPAPTFTPTPLPDEVLGLVVDVLDNESIVVVLAGDNARQTYAVRLLGIEPLPNTPDEPWGVVAYETQRQQLIGHGVRLERDETDRDPDGKLPRYIFLGDDFINLTLVEQGLARANVTRPDNRFAAQFEAAEAAARAAGRGLWGPDPTATPTVTATPAEGQVAPASTPTLTATVAITLTPTATVLNTATPALEATETVEATPTASQ
ncbi:MAG: thermonuclease family protein [Anaerolineae bacterium]